MSNETKKCDEGETSYKLYSKTKYGSEEPRVIGVDLSNCKDFTNYAYVHINLNSNSKGDD